MLTLYSTQIIGQVRSGKRKKLPFLRTVMLQDLKELSGLASMNAYLLTYLLHGAESFLRS